MNVTECMAILEHMGNTVGRAVSRVLVALLVIAVLAGGVFAFMHRQQINDHFAAQRFEPSAQIASLTDRMLLTDAGHRIFWATEPTLEASQHFNDQCSQVDHAEGSHVLGCYSGDNIHLFEVTDDRLDGIVEVTAVHELLHAVFARLGDDERSSLAKKLRELYEEIAAEDPVLAERMSVYSSLSDTAFANELHSVLGTEQRELPDWLEDHYSIWLQDRGAILDHFDSYHSIFDELKGKADALQAEMTALREDVEQRSAAYDQEVERFNAEWEDFIRRNEAYEFSDNPDEFYRLRTDFYDRREVLSAEMNSLNADIARYEEMRTELLELSELNHELEQLLDSELAPPSVPIDEV